MLDFTTLNGAFGIDAPLFLPEDENIEYIFDTADWMSTKMRDAISNTLREYYADKEASAETRKLMRKSRKEYLQNNPHNRLGKTHTDAVKQKLSKLYKGKPFPGIHNSNQGTTWWNNGQTNKRSVECPGDDWIAGRLPLGPYRRN